MRYECEYMVDRHQLGSPRDEDKGSGLIEEKSEYQRTTQDDRGSGFASLAQDEGEHPDSAGQEHQRRRLISDEMPIVRGGQRGAPVRVSEILRAAGCDRPADGRGDCILMRCARTCANVSAWISSGSSSSCLSMSRHCSPSKERAPEVGGDSRCSSTICPSSCRTMWAWCATEVDCS